MPKTIGEDGVVRLTAPHAYHLWSSVVGYHVPRSIANTKTVLRALGVNQ